MSLTSRVWLSWIIAPTAFAMAYGFWFQAPRGSAQSPGLFVTLARIISLQWWAVMWLTAGVLAVGAAADHHRNVGRAASGLAWSLATGLLVSVLWARFVDDVRVTWVGISWAWFLFAGCGYASTYSWLSHRE